MDKRLLILGLGNDILRDHGIGPRIVNHLKSLFRDEQIEFMTAAVGGLDVIDIIQGFKNVIIFDAIKTEGGIPGTIYQYQPSDFRETAHLSSLHDISFLTALELGKRLGMKIPKNIKIIAIEIDEDMEFGEEFTPVLKKKYKDICLYSYLFVNEVIGKSAKIS